MSCDHLLVDKSCKAYSHVIIFIILSYFSKLLACAGCESLDNKTLFLFHQRSFIAAANYFHFQCFFKKINIKFYEGHFKLGEI